MKDSFMKEKPVLPLLVSMALPMVISMLVNSLYNIVDSFFVARISEQAMTCLLYTSTINHPVVVGGVLVHPGDVILGDWDGIAVIPCEEAAEVLRLADMRREKEKGVMERLRRGESLFDIYGYQETFQALGVTEE